MGRVTLTLKHMSVIVTIKKNDTLLNAIALLLSDSEYIETSLPYPPRPPAAAAATHAHHWLECRRDKPNSPLGIPFRFWFLS